MDDLDLTVHMQFTAWRWPFREGDQMEFWNREHVCVLALPYDLVMRAVRLVYIDGVVLAMAQRLAPRVVKPLTPARARVLPFTSDQRREFRVQRRQRRKA